MHNLYVYDRGVDVSEGFDVNKTSESKKWDICPIWYFLNKGFKYQPHVCNRYNYLLMMFMKLNDIAILNIKGSNYCGMINEIGKYEDLNVMQNTDLTKKTEHYEFILLKMYCHI